MQPDTLVAFTAREFHRVLAALRHYSASLYAGDASAVDAIATNGDEYPLPAPEEIDGIADRINTTDAIVALVSVAEDEGALIFCCAKPCRETAEKACLPGHDPIGRTLVDLEQVLRGTGLMQIRCARCNVLITERPDWRETSPRRLSKREILRHGGRG